MVVIKLSANLASTMYIFVKIACNVALIKSNLILNITYVLFNKERVFMTLLQLDKDAVRVFNLKN